MGRCWRTGRSRQNAVIARVGLCLVAVAFHRVVGGPSGRWLAPLVANTLVIVVVVASTTARQLGAAVGHQGMINSIVSLEIFHKKTERNS